MNAVEPEGMPGGRWLMGCVFVHAVAEFSAWITVLVVAFDRGGSSAAGLAVTAQLVPAALLAPVVAAAGDRFRRHRVLTASFAVQALATAAITFALLADSPLALVYAFAAVFTVASIPVTASVASLLVHHARTPTQLTQWNITRSFVRASGSLAGPLLTALVLAVGDPAAVFAGLAVACTATALLTGRLLLPDDRLPSSLSIATVLDDTWRGLVYVSTHRAPRRIVAFVGATEMLIGGLDLVFVAVAFDQLGRGGSAVALITAAFATGTLLAAVTAIRRRGRHLGPSITLGAALLCLPLVAIGETTWLVAVLALTAILGAGNGLIEIGTHTLLQRSCAETMTSRAYGALDSTTLVAAAIGAALAGRLIDDGDLAQILVALGVGGSIVLMLGSLQLWATGRSIRSADPTLVSALRSVSFLEQLPQPTLDRLARGCELRSVPADRPVVAEGERGDEFFVLPSGAIEVHKGTDLVARLSAPASFGEIALLHGEVRTASVITTQSSEFAVIRQHEFLDAVGRTATSYRNALDVARHRRRPTKPQ